MTASGSRSRFPQEASAPPTTGRSIATSSGTSIGGPGDTGLCESEKGGNPFCCPEHIRGQMDRLFTALERDRCLSGLDAADFSGRTAHSLGTLNAIHPFRDGNGRSQTAFLLLLARRAGHPLAMARFEPDAFRAAMIASFAADEEPLRRRIHDLVV